MKIVVIGGTGLIGSKVVGTLRAQGHEVVAGAPSTGVNAVTGEGLADALVGAAVVVDVANAPSFEDQAAMDFFQAAGRHLSAAEIAAGVKHHVALSVVGTERLPGSGYFRAKLAQEALIQASPVPYTLLRATQFFEFMGAIAQAGMRDGAVHLSTAPMQPMAAQDVAAAVAEAALAAPVNGIREVAGPESRPLSDFVGDYLRAKHDAAAVVANAAVPYFGVVLDDRSLMPGADARLMPTRYATWLAQSVTA